jgi:hypothetical protein
VLVAGATVLATVLVVGAVVLVTGAGVLVAGATVLVVGAAVLVTGAGVLVAGATVLAAVLVTGAGVLVAGATVLAAVLVTGAAVLVTGAAAAEAVPVAFERGDEGLAADALPAQTEPAPTAIMLTAIAMRSLKRTQSTLVYLPPFSGAEPDLGGEISTHLSRVRPGGPRDLDLSTLLSLFGHVCAQPAFRPRHRVTLMTKNVTQAAFSNTLDIQGA